MDIPILVQTIFNQGRGTDAPVGKTYIEIQGIDRECEQSIEEWMSNRTSSPSISH